VKTLVSSMKGGFNNPPNSVPVGRFGRVGDVFNEGGVQ